VAAISSGRQTRKKKCELEKVFFLSHFREPCIADKTEIITEMEAAATLLFLGAGVYVLASPAVDARRLATDDESLENVFVVEALRHPLKLDLNLPSAVNSNLIYAPTPDFRQIGNNVGDFREWKIANARFQGRERRFGANGAVWGDRHTGDPIRFVNNSMTRVPYNEIW